MSARQRELLIRSIKDRFRSCNFDLIDDSLVLFHNRKISKAKFMLYREYAVGFLHGILYLIEDDEEQDCGSTDYQTRLEQGASR